MSQLYLCEKPSQAKTLAQLVGADSYVDGVWHGHKLTVVAAQGHLLELATLDEYGGKGKWAIEDLPVLPREWVLQVKTDERSQALFKKIGHYLKAADHVVIATDPDDEGELIGRDILHAHNFSGKISRLWASALNPDALRAALNNLLPLSATDGNYRAASLRRKLDWLFGMNLSRAFSVAFGKTTHVGRIKTRLLAELVKRDRAIAEFKPAQFHEVVATIGGNEFQYAGMSAPALLGQDVLSMLTGLAGATGVVTSVLEDSIEIAPPLPYTLSSLLSDGVALGINLSTGYAATQGLYEAGAISYPRSGSTALPSADNEAFAAHSAIVVTGALPVSASKEMSEIFNLVQQNLQMQVFGATTVNRRTVLVDVGGSVFRLQEQWAVPGKEGFVRAMQPSHPLYRRYQSLSKRPRQAYKKGAKLVVSNVETKCLETAAPAPFNEASMLKMMATNNLGTEATRVSAINSLVKDGVAVVSVPTDERDIVLPAPVVLSSTNWAQDIASKLPASILGEEMTTLVKSAQETARSGEVNLDRHLLDATKWMLWAIPEPRSGTGQKANICEAT
jgi:DNA topoisomerase-3